MFCGSRRELHQLKGNTLLLRLCYYMINIKITSHDSKKHCGLCIAAVEASYNAGFGVISNTRNAKGNVLIKVRGTGCPGA